MSEDNQLNMNFYKSNSLRQAVKNGNFCFILEYNPPHEDVTQLDYLPSLQKLAAEAAQRPDITCFSISDKLQPQDLDSINFCREIFSQHRMPPLLHVSGCDRSLSDISSRIAEGIDAGARSVLALSGNFRADTELYCESPDILHAARKADEQLFIGAGVNPFKYSVNSTYAQYLKMVQKVNAGAEFIVTQAGLDMRKYDEILRYCTMRELSIPMIARVTLVREDMIKQFREGHFEPGVHCSREFANYIEREAEKNPDFHALQMKRLALQIRGCRLMGYNGVQVKGIRTAVQLHQLLAVLGKLEKEILSLSDWQRIWKEFHGGVSLCSPPADFYIFRNWEKSRPVDREAEGAFELERNGDFVYPPQNEIRKYKMLRSLHAEKEDSTPASLLRKFSGLQDAPGDLRQLQFLNMNECAKKLLHGICGGSSIDGMCENGKDRCIHLKRTALAAYFNELDILENPDC